MPTESVMPSNLFIFCCLCSLLPSVFPSIRVFSNELAPCIRWPKYCSFSISPSSEYSGLISFSIDWFDLLVVQGTIKSLLQHCSLKESILWCSVFMVQFSHPHTTTGKTIALAVCTFVGKVMSLLFNMLSRLVIGWLKCIKFIVHINGTADLTGGISLWPGGRGPLLYGIIMGPSCVDNHLVAEYTSLYYMPFKEFRETTSLSSRWEAD